MKTKFYKMAVLSIYAGILFSSCTLFKDEEEKDFPVDPVCGMKVNQDERFTLNHNGKEYYFDSYNCRETFKMNPDKFTNNASVKTETTNKK